MSQGASPPAKLQHQSGDTCFGANRTCRDVGSGRYRMNIERKLHRRKRQRAGALQRQLVSHLAVMLAGEFQARDLERAVMVPKSGITIW